MATEYKLSHTAEEIDKKLSLISLGSNRVKVFEQLDALFEVTNLGLYAHGTDVNAAPFQYVEGDTYVVVWGDTEYECVSSTNTFQDQTYTGIGNLALMGMGDNTGEPFISIYVPYYDQIMIYSSDTEDTTRDVTIYHVEEVSSVGSGGSGGFTLDEIWTNSTPSSEFEYQTLTFENSYKLFVIQYKYANTSNQGGTIVLIPNSWEQYMTGIVGLYDDFAGNNTYETACYYGSRTCSATENSIYFGTAVSYKFGATSNMSFKDNTRCVPYKIFGVA